MKNYRYLFLSIAALASSTYATDKKIKKNAAVSDKTIVVSSSEHRKKGVDKKSKDDEFKLGKIVVLNKEGFKKKRGFTYFDKLPSWDFGYGAPAWLTKPGAKVIVPRSNGHYTYGIVLDFKHPIITVLIDRKADGSYETKEFRTDKLSALKWIHNSWIIKKRGALLMDKEKAFVNYNHVTKNFDPLVF